MDGRMVRWQSGRDGDPVSGESGGEGALKGVRADPRSRQNIDATKGGP